MLLILREKREAHLLRDYSDVLVTQFPPKIVGFVQNNLLFSLLGS